MRFLMGVDGGGSSTRAAIVASGIWQVLGQGTAGSSNHYSVGAPVAAENCHLAVQRALAAARRDHPELSLETISAWGFGLAGVRRRRDALLMREQLKKQFPDAARLILETDAVAAHYGAFGGSSSGGVMLSAGTGAIGLGIDEENAQFYADGWGPLLGDLGSGYWIGQEALRAVCHAQDSQDAALQEMRKVLLERLELEDWDALIRWVYAPETSRGQVAQLSRAVFELASAGDASAIEIQKRAGVHLADTAVLVAQKMLRNRKKSEEVSASISLPIVLRGGVFADQNFENLVRRAIEERTAPLKEEFPLLEWRFLRPRFGADIGAAICAQKIKY